MKKEDLLNARVFKNTPELKYLGEQMFLMETQEGFPGEFFFDKMKEKCKFNNEELAIIVANYHSFLLQHKLKSGMEFLGAQHKKLQKQNYKTLEKIFDKGIYD